MTFPTLINLNSGFVCSSGTYEVTISCFQSSASVLAVTMVGSGTIPTSITWNITNVQNTWYAETSIFTFVTTTNDTTYYYMEKGTASITMQPISLTLSYTPNNQLVLLSASTLNIQITNSFTISTSVPSLLKITITLPTQLTLTNTTCSTSISGTLCTNGGN
jgi:hypothetical protein